MFRFGAARLVRVEQTAGVQARQVASQPARVSASKNALGQARAASTLRKCSPGDAAHNARTAPRISGWRRFAEMRMAGSTDRAAA
jgi:hypothetical protein